MNNPDKPHSGRPRDKAIHDAALQAALTILAQNGYDHVTFAAVATKAGISRPALYRRWTSKDALLADALQAQRQPDSVPDTGSLREDLRQAAQVFVRHFSTPVGKQAILDLLRAQVQHTPAARIWATKYGAPRIKEFKVMFSRAIARGELSASADIDVMMYILSAALLQSCLVLNHHQGSKTGPTPTIEDVIDFILTKP